MAPYDVHIILLAGKNNVNGVETKETAFQLESQLHAAGIESLLDDRDESPGVKFNDADLIGNPIRITVSERALTQGGVEYKRRDQSEKVIIPLENIVSKLVEDIRQMNADIMARCTDIPYH
jgi:prolyl-tRNA synthetase